jgi:probable addiction module antidote protein
MPKRTRPYRESLLEDLQDPAEAATYLNAALIDSDEMFLVALRDVAEARQMAQVAESVGVARESLYRMLRSEGNPTYVNLIGILRAVGLKLSVAPTALTDLGGPEPFKGSGSFDQTIQGRSSSQPVFGGMLPPRKGMDVAGALTQSTPSFGQHPVEVMHG